MKIRKAYRFKLKPTEEQAHTMERIAGHCRFLWNKLLRLSLDRLHHKQNILWYHEADFWSKLWKASDEYGFLREAPAHCLQQKMKDLHKAFKDAFDKNQPRKWIPKFRKRGIHDSFRFPEPKHIHIDNRRIKLPKLGWIGFYKSCSIEGKVKNVTVSRQAGDWYISIQVECNIDETLSSSSSAIGVDMGIKHFAACSDGSYHAPIHAFRTLKQRLAKAQRCLARKKRFSENWKKQKRRIQKIHRMITHTRGDFLHKLSTTLCKNHAMIVVEDLNIANMSRSARGTVETPGRSVKAKSGLNQSILDQGWGEFRRQLEYKLAWAGGIFLAVNPKYTSQRCGVCGYTEKANRVEQERFCCQACGHRDNADRNAAKNILAAGHAVLACGERGLPHSMKQELLGTGDLVPA